MLWLVWRQHRMQLLITSALLLAFGTVLLVHGLRTADRAAGLAPGSEELARVLTEQFRGLNSFVTWFPLVPALVGLFLGAPLLAREFESGTTKLAWTQSVAPRRWLTTKLTVLGAMVTLAGLAFGGMVNAWLTVFDDTGHDSRFRFVPLFGGSGVASAAWWLLAFMLGVAAGAMWRRTVPAMAVAFAAYAAAFVVVASPVVDFRDHYAEPLRTVQTSMADSLADGAVRTGSDWLGRDGRVLGADMYTLAMDAGCADQGTRIDYSPCLFDNGYRLAVEYFPPSLYWRFQWTEAVILAIAAVAIGGGVVWSVRRRV